MFYSVLLVSFRCIRTLCRITGRDFSNRVWRSSKHSRPALFIAGRQCLTASYSGVIVTAEVRHNLDSAEVAAVRFLSRDNDVRPREWLDGSVYGVGRSSGERQSSCSRENNSPSRTALVSTAVDVPCRLPARSVGLQPASGQTPRARRKILPRAYFGR